MDSESELDKKEEICKNLGSIFHLLPVNKKY